MLSIKIRNRGLAVILQTLYRHFHCFYFHQNKDVVAVTNLSFLFLALQIEGQGKTFLNLEYGVSNLTLLWNICDTKRLRLPKRLTQGFKTMLHKPMGDITKH